MVISVFNFLCGREMQKRSGNKMKKWNTSLHTYISHNIHIGTVYTYICMYIYKSYITYLHTHLCIYIYKTICRQGNWNCDRWFGKVMNDGSGYPATMSSGYPAIMQGKSQHGYPAVKARMLSYPRPQTSGGLAIQPSNMQGQLASSMKEHGYPAIDL